MSFWSSETLRKRIPAEGLIAPYDRDRVKYAAYELGLGLEAYQTPDGVKWPYSRGEQVSIPPGQFALLLSDERVKIPKDAIAFISIRYKYKRRGLVNVSGFHVDPGYEGQLIFSVYNAGSRDVVMDVGAPVFMIWFAALDYPTENVRGKIPGENGRAGIRDFEVGEISGEVSSPAQLRKDITNLKTQVQILMTFVAALLVAAFSLFGRVTFNPPAIGQERHGMTSGISAGQTSALGSLHGKGMGSDLADTTHRGTSTAKLVD